jgi:Subtilase family
MLSRTSKWKAPRWLLAIGLGGATALIAISAGAASAQTAQARAHRSIIFLHNDSRLPVRSAAHAAIVRAEQAPLLSYLHRTGAHVVAALGAMDAIVANLTPREASTLARDPSVAHVFRDGIIPGPNPLLTSSFAERGHASSKLAAATPSSAYCGTVGSPELDPEALTNINATPSQLGSIDGAGVTVAYVADGIDATDPDFQRNAAFASTGSPAGSPVLSQVDFTGDGSSAATPGGEAFGDASSIAAQGNTTYDLSSFVNAAHSLPSGCDIQVVGVAPGADVVGLKVFSSNNDTTESNFIQAINYAVTNGAKVINESFGANQFPDTTLDATRLVDDAAVAAGVTVVASTGDGGITSTIGSPASDPNVISVGASTTFRSYAQVGFGGITDPNANGNFTDNNISSLSSSGFTQSGGTVDLVAPGDLNFALCTANTSLYSDCTNESQTASNLELFGGTSESSPLTAGAAADVIQAYASTHAGADPTPALVKQILMSTATDIGAPATEQGAGLLNVLAAVKEAESIQGTTGTPQGGLLISPNQLDVTQPENSISFHRIHLTNTGNSPVTVQLASRMLPTTPTASQTGSFCMQPGTPSTGCPANTGVFPIWSGVNEVYQDETFTVPSTTGGSVLKFAADYPFTGQTSLLHFGLLEPDGTFAAYSLPQGLGDFGQVEVDNPPAGTWTAVFFTEQNGATPGGIGTSGNIDWSASTFQYGTGDTITPSSLVIGAGQTAQAIVDFETTAAGDEGESLTFTTTGGTNTIPVVVRTIVPTNVHGGSFSGVLAGGNGRANTESQTNTYQFNVPAKSPAVSVHLQLADDPNDAFIAFLVDPTGRTVGYSTNETTDNFFKPVSTLGADLYAPSPSAGLWSVIVDWENPVSGLELSEPFTGRISFQPATAISGLPNTAAMKLKRGATYHFHLVIQNTGNSPQAFFADPRLSKMEAVHLPDQNAYPGDTNLPLGPGFSFPYYFVPPDTSRLSAAIAGSVPVTFDLEYFPGDPDVAPGISAPGVSSTVAGDTASLSLSSGVGPGFWLMNPSEIGPYGSGGAPAATAATSLTAITQEFDPTITSSTGDAWTAFNGLSGSFSPAYVPVGDSANVTLTLRPTAKVGSVASGIVYVDDYVLGSNYGAALPDGDQLVAIPYRYTVK